MAQAADELKTLFVSGMDGDTQRYRCFHHQEQLAMQGVTTKFCESDDPQLLVDALVHDVFVLHRVPYSRLIEAVIDVAHLRGKPVIFETDDLVFAPELYDHIGFVDTLSPEDARRFRRDLNLQAETFERCDCVLTTTDFLARQARDRGKPAYVHRNAPSKQMIEISEEAFAARCRRLDERRQKDQPLVVGYFSGTGSHNRDFRVIAEPLIWMLEAYPQTSLHISGHLELGPAMSLYGDRIRRAPYIDWRELPHLIARVDVNLAPLEQDNPFCRAKSENKFVEAALVGVPTIASPVEAFKYAVTDGEDGLLASTLDEWQAALKTLLDSPQKRREIGEAARNTVYAHYIPEKRSSELIQTLRCVVDRHRHPRLSAEQILHEWSIRTKHYAEELREDVLSREAQVESLRKMLRDYEDQLTRKTLQSDGLTAQHGRTPESVAKRQFMRLISMMRRLWGTIKG